MRHVGLALLLALALYGAWQLIPSSEPVVDVYYASDFTTAPEGVVGFPSWNAATGGELMAGPDNAEQQVNGGGLLVMPPQASAQNPVPAVVILHGSGGDWSGRSVYLANRLAKQGIAGFAVDTFVARNLRSTDDYYERISKASVFSQIIDGLNALQALQQHPYIQADKVAVAGFSLGAAAALYSMFEPVTEGVLGAQGPRFSAYASFYAGCSFDFEDFRVEGSPVLIMMGAEDESMSVPRCEWLASELERQGVDVEIKVYAEAAHGWEQPYPMAFKEGAAVTKNCIMLWTKEGETIEQTTGHSIDTPWGAALAFSRCATREGYTQGLHEPAKQQSWLDFHAFLLKAWAG